MENYEPRNIRLQITLMNLGGHVATILFAVGWIVCAKFLPAPSPLLSAEEITMHYVEHETGVRLGVTLMFLGFSMWIPWGSVLAAWARHVEKKDGAPVLTYVLISSSCIGAVVGVMCAFLWGVAAFRPGQLAPDITMTLNDMAWQMFLLPWGPFSVWCIAHSLVILRDKSSRPVFPRWLAGLGFWTAFIYIPAFAVLFFKDGGFAYDGLLGMYIPLIAFFIWMEGVNYTMVRSLKRELRRQESGLDHDLDTGAIDIPVHYSSRGR